MHDLGADSRVVGVTYDGAWIVSFILENGMEIPVRLGRGVADFIRRLIERPAGLRFEMAADGSWSCQEEG